MAGLSDELSATDGVAFSNLNRRQPGVCRPHPIGVIDGDDQRTAHETGEGDNAVLGRHHRASECCRDVDPSVPRPIRALRRLESPDDRALDGPCVRSVAGGGERALSLVLAGRRGGIPRSRMWARKQVRWSGMGGREGALSAWLLPAPGRSGVLRQPNARVGGERGENSQGDEANRRLQHQRSRRRRSALGSVREVTRTVCEPGHTVGTFSTRSSDYSPSCACSLRLRRSWPTALAWI